MSLQATSRSNLLVPDAVAAFDAVSMETDWRSHRACRIDATIQALDAAWRCDASVACVHRMVAHVVNSRSHGEDLQTWCS